LDISVLNEKIKQESAFMDLLLNEISKVIVGQRIIVEKMVVGLISNGHILLEGVPGLAKTLAIKTLAASMKAKFQRIQFTPDLLPADLIGTMIYNQKDGSFQTKKGPIFANFILADEINRSPAKVQSALLEAMQERQITIGEQTFPLPDPFLVLATQNPIEQEGTYPLPEAQVDRFSMNIRVDYPSHKDELDMLNAKLHETEISHIMSTHEVIQIRVLGIRLVLVAPEPCLRNRGSGEQPPQRCGEGRQLEARQPRWWQGTDGLAVLPHQRRSRLFPDLLLPGGLAPVRALLERPAEPAIVGVPSPSAAPAGAPSAA